MSFLFLLILLPFSLFASSLELLEKTIKKEFELLSFPPPGWLSKEEGIYDVVIIGGGISGLTIGHALKKQGILNIQIFDSSDPGKEGPWLTSAKMKTLRTSKDPKGAALGHGYLTFRSWFTAQYGENEWENLRKISTSLWASYLQWIRKVLDLPVKNNCKLELILPQIDQTFILLFENGQKIHAKKVVLATGRAGFGGFEIPSYTESLPKTMWMHSGEVFDCNIFNQKTVCVVGAGASAYDAAGSALEAGASQVYMLMRREAGTSQVHMRSEECPCSHYFTPLSHIGYQRGYFYLSDESRCHFFQKAIEAGTPPPAESITRATRFSSFELLPKTCIEEIQRVNHSLKIRTNHGVLTTDFLILATGYAIDGAKQKELSAIYDKIALWGDRISDLRDFFAHFPYLGPHFQFLEKHPGEAPYLRHLYCFNYGAFLSHGSLSGDVDEVAIGAERLAEGIAIDFFCNEEEKLIATR